jgi:uncharacterized protein (AIM24 family)
MVSHEIDYKIFGDDIQFVEIELDPRETVIAEAGAMVYMEQDITFEVKMGDGSTPNQGLMGKLFQSGSRIITGESLFLTHFTNNGYGKSRVAFAAPYPGTIIAVYLRAMRNSLIVQKDGFLCAAMGTKLSVTLNQWFSEEKGSSLQPCGEPAKYGFSQCRSESLSALLPRSEETEEKRVVQYLGASSNKEESRTAC